VTDSVFTSPRLSVSPTSHPYPSDRLRLHGSQLFLKPARLQHRLRQSPPAGSSPPTLPSHTPHTFPLVSLPCQRYIHLYFSLSRRQATLIPGPTCTDHPARYHCIVSVTTPFPSGRLRLHSLDTPSSSGRSRLHFPASYSTAEDALQRHPIPLGPTMTLGHFPDSWADLTFTLQHIKVSTSPALPAKSLMPLLHHSLWSHHRRRPTPLHRVNL